MTSIRFHITEDDYVAAQRLHMRTAMRRSAKWVVVFCILLYAAFGAWHRIWWAVAIALSALALPWLIDTVLLGFTARRSYRRYPAMHGEQTLTVTNDGVQATSTMGNTDLRWPMVIRWAEDAEFMLLYLQPRMYFIVPLRADTDGTVGAQLREQLLRHVGQPRGQ